MQINVCNLVCRLAHCMYVRDRSIRWEACTQNSNTFELMPKFATFTTCAKSFDAGERRRTESKQRVVENEKLLPTRIRQCCKRTEQWAHDGKVIEEKKLTFVSCTSNTGFSGNVTKITYSYYNFIQECFGVRTRDVFHLPPYKSSICADANENI